ncbi:unnamed protein product [Prunus brigantina]
MKQLIMGRFLRADYEQYLYRLCHNFHQGNQTIFEYTDEFLGLTQSNNLEETNGQMVARYITGLRSSLHEKLRFKTLWTVHKAQKMVLKAELLEKEKRIGSSVSGIKREVKNPLLHRCATSSWKELLSHATKVVAEIGKKIVNKGVILMLGRLGRRMISVTGVPNHIIALMSAQPITNRSI